ncbi:hypothetical protein [Mesorhizobium sp. YM1C-6-2]|uniref:hypothetical protein n=1 Tax=Mesorhizobium sp. YM1C-6-2 TaxID=1827501 RepID=UPI000EF209A4|nr:hypothetical protein [Mesorhizobium sp. YM1C-6-2]RLP26594.1 hypothetical protein D8676_04980 [Mesorhizobium sp. YM1C-6-2]
MKTGNGLFGTSINAAGIKPIAIQPTGTAGSTFVRPQQRETGKNLAALADALGGFNAALQSFGSVAAGDAKDPDSEANRAFADSIAGMSLEEAMEKYPEARNRIQKDGVLTLVGSKAAYEFRQHVTEKYNSGEFDQNSGDFNAWVETQRQEYAQGLRDPAMQAAFFRGTDNWVQQFGEADLKRKLETTLQERDTAVVDEFRMIAEDGLGRLDSPEKIAQDIINQSSQNRTFRGLDGKSQNDTLYRLAEEYAAKGQPELVKALLHNRRNGVGPLIEVTGYTDRGLELVKRAEGIEADAANASSFRSRAKLDEDAMYGRLTQEQLEAARRQKGNEWLTDPMAAQYLETSKRNKANLLEAQQREEAKRRAAANSTYQRTQIEAAAFAEMETLQGAHRLKDVEYDGPDGTPRTLTAKQQQEAAVKRKLSEFEDEYETLTGKGVALEAARREVLKRRVAWFDGNGIVDEDMQGRFNSLNVVSSISRVLEKGEVSDYLSGIAEDYRELANVNPAYADKMLTDNKAAVFLQNYADARKDRMGHDDALIFAAQQSNRSTMQRALVTPAPKDLEKAVKDLLGDLDYGAEPNLDNRAWVQDTLTHYMVDRGMSLERAKQRVADKLKESSFEINGVLIIDEDGLPKDAPELFEFALQDAFEVFGKEEGIPDVEDLYIDKFASGQWIVMSKTKGNAPLNFGSRISLEDLARIRGREARKVQDLREAARQKDSASRLRTWEILEAYRVAAEKGRGPRSQDRADYPALDRDEEARAL